MVKLTLRGFKEMVYSLYNEKHELIGQFKSIYELQTFIHDFRVNRDEWRIRKNKDVSVFDYIKSIGYSWDVVPVQQVSQEEL
tara:strand:- start:594 stop:839 length:246 start_codon:yes stop_codon:yes gene_type:complete